MSILYQLGLWRENRRIRRKAKMDLPGNLEVHIWELDNANPNTGVGVIEKKKQGGFLSFHVEGKSFGAVKSQYRRKAAKMRASCDGNL